MNFFRRMEPKGEGVVVKVQRQLDYPDSDEFLVYDEKRHFVRVQEIDGKAIKAMGKREGMLGYKTYFSAVYNRVGAKWIIGKMVEDQKW